MQKDDTMPTIEELISFKHADLALDLIEEYAAFRNIPEDAAKEIVKKSGLNLDPGSDLPGFYQRSDDFLISLIRSQIQIRHLNARVSFVEKLLAGKKGLEVIDLGGGLGNYCIGLTRSGHQCTYADIPGVIMDFAGHRFAARSLDVALCDVRALPEKKYHVLLSFDVLEHLEDPISALVEYAMHCQPGGTLFLAADFMNFGEPFHLRKNFSYSFVYESILVCLGFKLAYHGGFSALESILKAGTRIYILKNCSYDRGKMLAAAREIALQKFNEYQSYFQAELDRLG